MITGTRDLVEADILSSLGLLPKQMVGLLIIKHLFVAIIGMFLGIWAGLQMTKLSVPVIFPVDASVSPLPPIVIATDWLLVTGVCVTSFIVFTTTILLINKQILGTKLSKNRR